MEPSSISSAEPSPEISSISSKPLQVKPTDVALDQLRIERSLGVARNANVDLWVLRQDSLLRAAAKPLPLVGEVAQLRPKFRVRRPTGAITDHRAVGVHDRAGPPFRQVHHRLQMRDPFALGDGPYHFFARSSRSAAASSICSA